MAEPSVIHSTFVVERAYPAAPDRIFAAFADPVRKRRWFVEGGGHEIQHYELDFRVAGKEHARFTFKGGSPVQGLVCDNEGYYLDIVPDRRIVTASTMTIGGRCISASLVTFEFLPTGAGCDLLFTHQGAFFEGADGPKMREEGWNKLLDRLPAELAR
uniref:Activator of Hsp90 ATPase 1 family protein n=1 Tax=Solibacter usitatus (strain Ellin6076) TaxID=234267 RepID=Q027A5_SOLUE